MSPTLTQNGSFSIPGVSIASERSRTEKTHFVSQNLKTYGYSGKIDKIREQEYPQLKDQVYLDHAGATTYASSQIQRFTKDLTSNLYGNPHSQNPSSKLSSTRVERVRNRILKYFEVSGNDYTVIFTQNATAAIKLAGEMFPWSKEQKSRFLYLREAHTSLVGLRASASASGAVCKPISQEGLEEMFQSPSTQGNEDGILEEPVYNLLAYPAQCNFSGSRFPLEWTRTAYTHLNTEKENWKILLDASSYLTSSQLSLHNTQESPDFVSLSFYKLFGFPTGLGALLVKSELAPLLTKTYFGGGTVSGVTYDHDWQVFRGSLSGKYEDGTINFLDIIALDHALDVAEELYGDVYHITQHTNALITYMYKQMTSLKHWNGAPVCAIFSNGEHYGDPSKQGPIINFNLKRANGDWVGYTEIERLATASSIHVRTGGFCNPGAMQRWLNLSSEEVQENLSAGHVCWDDKDIIGGKPTGSIRISLGAMSTFEDVIVWINFLKEFFVNDIEPNNYSNSKDGYDLIESLSETTLDSVCVYPIKSCHGFHVPTNVAWPITPSGLKYDHEWMLVNNDDGSAMSMKRITKMALIRASIEEEAGYLVVTAPNKPSLRIPLAEDSHDFAYSRSNVFGELLEVQHYKSQSINEWFSTFLEIPCHLARQLTIRRSLGSHLTDNAITPNSVPSALNGSKQASLSLQNESPYLLISQVSVDDVNDRISQSEINQEKKSVPVFTDAYRGNIVIRGRNPYEEDQWEVIKIGTQVFKILGSCRRCNMLCVNPETGRKTKEPYVTLAKYRRIEGKILFGRHMYHCPELSQAPFVLRENDPVKGYRHLDDL
ncbi:hypothetical protein K7432_007088 [Basidiobolus ranarum]|uniref:Molybdenum cofactor sulfurase n=1 Tax=Basidiobolus ranarum TaxID=34480 RepID=A0ABR2WTX4_9FUNG